MKFERFLNRKKREGETRKMTASSSTSSSWQEFYGQTEAFEALRDSSLTLFAFQRSPKPSRRQHVGSMMYVLADRDLVGRVCLGLGNYQEEEVVSHWQIMGLNTWGFMINP